MKKSILNLGKALKKADQKQINGGITSGPCYQEGTRCCEYRPWGLFCDAGRCGTYGCFWY